MAGNLKMITSLAKVRDRLGITELEVQWDAQLTDQIVLTLARFETEMSRKLERGVGVVEEFDAGKKEVSLERYPVEEITKWEMMVDGVWVERAGVVAVARGKGGVVTLSEALGSVGGLARVTYTGGYVLPDPAGGEGLYPLPQILEIAAVETVVHWWQWKGQINMTQVEIPSTGEYREIGDRYWVPWVRAVLKKYRRFVI